MNKTNKNKSYINILLGLFIFVIACSLFSYLQFNKNNPYLSQGDSFYHVKMAELIRDQGIPQEFPWLHFTALRDNFVDHQLFFHIALIPFITIFGSILGAKIFEVAIISLVFVLMFIILKQQKIKGAFLFTILTLFTMPADFYYRMSSIRDIGLSLLFILTGLYCLFKNKPLALGITCFLYVWAYGGFMFLPILAMLYFVIELLISKKYAWKILLFATSGMILGFIINPYFSKNLDFLFSQIFQTGLGAKEYTGGEWRPYDTWFWVKTNYLPLIIFSSGIFISFIKNVKQNTKTLTLFILAIIFLVLQWKSKRFVEYCPFFLTMSGFLLLKPFLNERIDEFKNKTFFKKNEKYFYLSTFVIFIFLAIFFSITQIESAREDTKTDFSMSAIQKVHDYLKEFSAEGDIVFTDDWDVFPLYFFINSKNYYLVGLDPEFMNQYQGVPYEGEKEKLYQEFAAISSGKDSFNLERIKNHFQAKWIIVKKDHPNFYKNLKSKPSLFQEILFATNDSSIDNYSGAFDDGYYLFKVL